MSTQAYESTEDATIILDQAEQILFNLSQDAERGRFKPIEPILHDVLDNWGSRKKGAFTGIPTGYYDLDNLLSGMQKSDLIICAGRPSMGKTALALCMARNAAVDYGHRVGLFSLEMSNSQLVERLIADEDACLNLVERRMDRMCYKLVPLEFTCPEIWKREAVDNAALEGFIDFRNVNGHRRGAKGLQKAIVNRDRAHFKALE